VGEKILNKKIYNISGFPRAGNTLLACLLNQNPAVKATGHSVVPDMLYQLSAVQYTAIYKNIPDTKSYDSVLGNVISNYYKGWDCDFVIERGDWITPFNFNILKQYAPNEIKIVILVRDILDIITSYIDVCNENPLFHINQEYNKLDKTTLYTDEIETKCDLVMRKEGYVDMVLYSIKGLLDNNDLSNIKFVEYSDLVNTPKDTMQQIGEFYGLPSFDYSFTNLSQFEVNAVTYDDSVLHAPLHIIETDGIRDIVSGTKLPDSVIRKYSNLEFWRN
jgi:hypothetical protein